MTRRWLLMVWFVVLSATPLFAQPQDEKRKADPLSGTWSGELAPPGGALVTMELEFDGKRAVSGTISGFSNPGDVKTGTFDPKTGALKLELGKTGDSAVLLTLEGTVIKGEATGRVTGEVTGDFKIVKKKK
jgi:hypothetical protein